MSLNELRDVCYYLAKSKGFWEEGENRNVGEALMLIVTEISEAMEGYRKGDMDNFKEELADTFIRLLDLCGGMKIDIQTEVAKKLKYNASRPYKHGKRF